ncbi:ABC transporter substrate-binding protein [Sulfurospirillum barnesii]|uniref:ABC-type Fe3+-hydroxamate transport system, periplasmic component n=1 Tax=Sulfurospirillum barnesii (strain ATCC 700032 / DSM 10660 / SES-3) TaxID=760154 RepID=I3XZV7_SULBS|nr:ABC transporter substrate-binding protein [Sulfurospirillum barnesii]AFL69481.1 ABC-type Fe3+-hydroxamate transport system, periplasmic component [Sulfurospirillum barnesii SES-3]
MKKILSLLLLFATMLFSQTYTDMLGRKVSLEKSDKIVCIGPGALRLAVYLGLENRLVGIEKTENDPSALSPYRTFLGKEKISKLPIIGTGGPGKMPDLEALLVAKPDFIIASFVDKNQLELIASKTNIPLIAISYGASYGGTSKKNLDDIKNSLLLLGDITHTSQRAHALVAFIKAQEEALGAISLPSQKLYVGGIGYKGVQGLTSTEATYPPFELLGLKNSVFEGTTTQGHQFIELEALMKNDPDIIFIDLFGKQKVEQDYLTQKALYDTLKAYKTGNVKEILGFNFYSTNVENLLVIAWQIAAHLGAPVDVNEKAHAIFNAFYTEPKGSVLLESLPYGFAKK